MLQRSNGQSAVEYAFMIAVVAAGLIAVAPYARRGMLGRLRLVGDNLGTGYVPRGTTMQGHTLTHKLVREDTMTQVPDPADPSKEITTFISKTIQDDTTLAEHQDVDERPTARLFDR